MFTFSEFYGWIGRLKRPTHSLGHLIHIGIWSLELDPMVRCRNELYLFSSHLTGLERDEIDRMALV